MFALSWLRVLTKGFWGAIVIGIPPCDFWLLLDLFQIYMDHVARGDGA